MVSDGNGGVILVWVDFRVQRIRPLRTARRRVWSDRLAFRTGSRSAPGGDAAEPSPDLQRRRRRRHRDLDGSRGAVRTKVYARRVTGAGVPVWTVADWSSRSPAASPKIVSDGAGGAVRGFEAKARSLCRARWIPAERSCGEISGCLSASPRGGREAWSSFPTAWAASLRAGWMGVPEDSIYLCTEDRPDWGAFCGFQMAC